MKGRRTYLCVVLAVLLSFPVLTTIFLPATAMAAESPYLNSTSKTLQVGEAYKLKLIHAVDVVQWKSSNEKVVSVDDKGKVKGLASGDATITGVYKKKSYLCTITVKHPNRSDDMEDKMIGPVNICYSKELITEVSESDERYVWTAKNSGGSDASEIIKLNIMKTSPKVYTYDIIEQLFLKEFKKDKTVKILEKQGYKDAKLKRTKKSAYKIPSGKAFRASAHISAEKDGEDCDEDQVIYLIGIPDYLIVISGQALDGGSFSTVDSTIKSILKTMTLL